MFPLFSCLQIVFYFAERIDGVSICPNHGVTLYGAETVLWSGIGTYSITSQQLFYLLNLLLKYFVLFLLLDFFNDHSSRSVCIKFE